MASSSDLNIVLLQSIVVLLTLVQLSISSESINHSLFVRTSNFNNLQSDNSQRLVRQNEPATDPMEQTVEQILLWLQGKYLASNRKARRENEEPPSRIYLPAYPSNQQPRPFKPAGEENNNPVSSSDTPETFDLSDDEMRGGPGASKNPSWTTNGQNGGASKQPLQPGTEPAKINPSSTGGEFAGTSDVPETSSDASQSVPENSDAQNQPNSSDSSSSPDDSIAPNVAEPVDNSLDSSGASASEGNHPPHIHEIVVQCAKDQMTINIEFDKPFNGIIYSKGFYASPECRYVEPNSGKTKFTFGVMLKSCGTQFVDGFKEGKQAYLENILVLQNEPGIQEVWDTVRNVRCLWEGNLNKALSVALSVGALSQEIVTFSGDTATARLDIQVGRGPFAPAATGLVKIGELMTLVVTVDGDTGFNVLVRECTARDENPSQTGNAVQLTDAQGCVVKSKLLGKFQTTMNPETNSVVAYAYFNVKKGHIWGEPPQCVLVPPYFREDSERKTISWIHPCAYWAHGMMIHFAQIAFKFPDVMDLIIECNVDLCKTACQPCPYQNQSIDPGRRRRREVNDSVLTEPLTLEKRMRVFTPDELESAGGSVTINVGASADSICLSTVSFVVSTVFLVTLSIGSSIISATLYLKNHRKSHLSFLVK